MNELVERCAKYAQRHKQYHERFFQSFGIRLGKFWNNLTGFDIIAFDDLIKPRKKESTKQAIQRKYGPEAVALIETLISAV